MLLYLVYIRVLISIILNVENMFSSSCWYINGSVYLKLLKPGVGQVGAFWVPQLPPTKTSMQMRKISYNMYCRHCKMNQVETFTE